ncbi:hypothetical protein YC2023_025048 [Brassica napus]
MYPSREGVVATDNSRRDRNRTDLYSMTKPHSSVDNSYSFHRSIPLLLMDMSGIFFLDDTFFCRINCS